MAKDKEVTWLGETTCNFCHQPTKDFLVDGKTAFGPWAVMCLPCFRLFGRGIGIGIGQLFQLNPLDNKYTKVGG